MFTRALKEEDRWRLFDSLENEFRLPCLQDYSGTEIAIGVMGTRTRETVSGYRHAKTKTLLMAEMLAALKKTIYLLDVRRDGVGGQGSWAPREFASLIPEGIAGRVPYAFIHLPCLAPSTGLLKAWRDRKVTSWDTFKQRYQDELSDPVVAVGQAFVEAAVACGGMAVFMCAESLQADFDHLPPGEQHEHYCHRFTLARRIADRIRASYANVALHRVELDLQEFRKQWREAGEPTYLPRTVRL